MFLFLTTPCSGSHLPSYPLVFAVQDMEPWIWKQFSESMDQNSQALFGDEGAEVLM